MKISWHRYGRHDYITSRGKDNFVKKKKKNHCNYMDRIMD